MGDKDVIETASAVGPVDHREVEWQFDAVDVRPVERWLRGLSSDGQVHSTDGRMADQPVVPSGRLAVGEARIVTQVDTYLDTPDWRIHRAGYSLRLRRTRGTSEATLKSFGAASKGLRRRREISDAFPNNDLQVLTRSDGPVGDRIRAMAGRTGLAALFEVRTRRRAFDLSLDGVPAGEVVLDETSIPVGDGSPPTRMKRVEVEVPEPFVDALSSLVKAMRDECGLRPATLSKYEAGLLSRGLRPDQALDLGSTVIDRSLSVGEVAFAVMRRHFEMFAAKEPGTRLGEDPEELHDMRVAARRLRAAIAIFQEALPVRTLRFRDEIRWVAQALGAVRDLDVQFAQLDEWSEGDLEPGRLALEPLRAVLERERAEARGELLKALDSVRYARLLDGFAKLLRQGPLKRSPSSRAPIVDVASGLLQSRYRAVRRAGDRIDQGATAGDYHRLRIRCKRLRYALEFLADVATGQTRPLIRRLVSLQDLLGMQQDGDVATKRLQAVATRDGDGLLPPATVFAMGVVAERYARRGRDLRADFPKKYAKVLGKLRKGLGTVGKERGTARSEPRPIA